MADNASVKQPSTLTLLLVYGFPACITVALSPALRSIQQSFDITEMKVRMVMTLAMLAYAIGPLFSSWFTLHYGRRGAIMSGCAVALAGGILTIIAGYTDAYYFFLASRFLMTLGSALAFVVVYTVINDYYNEHQARSVLSIIAAAFCVAPGIIMAISGQLIGILNWQAINFFMLGYTLVTCYMVWYMPETGPETFDFRQSTRETMLEYGKLLTSRTFWYCNIITALAVSALYVYATDSSIIATSTLKLSATEFGYLSLIPYLGAILSLTLLKKYSHLISYRHLTYLSFALIGVASLAIFFFFLAGYITLWVVFGFTFVLIAGTMPLNVTYVTIAESHSVYRSSVASLMGASFMFMSVVAVQFSAVINPWLNDFEYPVTLLVLLVLLVATFAIMLADREGRNLLVPADQQEAA